MLDGAFFTIRFTVIIVPISNRTVPFYSSMALPHPLVAVKKPIRVKPRGMSLSKTMLFSGQLRTPNRFIL